MSELRQKTRIDKWLWSVRIFKSRTIASDACRSGRVKIGDTVAKPSATVCEGDVVQVKKEGFNLSFRVIRAIEKRVGAPIAVTCYANITPEAELNKYKLWFAASPVLRDKGAGRPTKKERRDIERFTGEDASFEAFDFDE